MTFLSLYSIVTYVEFIVCCSKVVQSVEKLDLENTVLDLASHSLSDRRWGVNIGQPMRHLLNQIFQQQINSAT